MHTDVPHISCFSVLEASGRARGRCSAASQQHAKFTSGSSPLAPEPTCKLHVSEYGEAVEDSVVRLTCILS